MAYYINPLYTFENESELGINELPLNVLVFIDSSQTIYKLDNLVGLTTTSTIQNAIDNNNIKKIIDIDQKLYFNGGF